MTYTVVEMDPAPPELVAMTMQADGSYYVARVAGFATWLHYGDPVAPPLSSFFIAPSDLPGAEDRVAGIEVSDDIAMRRQRMWIARDADASRALGGSSDAYLYQTLTGWVLSDAVAA